MSFSRCQCNTGIAREASSTKWLIAGFVTFPEPLTINRLSWRDRLAHDAHHVPHDAELHFTLRLRQRGRGEALTSLSNGGIFPETA